MKYEILGLTIRLLSFDTIGTVCEQRVQYYIVACIRCSENVFCCLATERETQTHKLMGGILKDTPLRWDHVL
jgi:hypothetical protein